MTQATATQKPAVDGGAAWSSMMASRLNSPALTAHWTQSP